MSFFTVSFFLLGEMDRRFVGVRKMPYTFYS